jgi:hypothetical protein
MEYNPDVPDREGRMKRIAALLSAAAALCAAGCGSRIAITDEIRNQISDDDLRRLQLYVSSDILLYRVLKSEETGVTRNHSLRLDKGRKLEEVLIAASTPGVIVKTDPKRLFVSFESPIDGEELFVTFEKGHNGNSEGYYMYPDSMSEKGEMIVNYGGKIYVATMDSRVSHLVVDQDKVKVTKYEGRQVPGRRVTDGPTK